MFDIKDNFRIDIIGDGSELFRYGKPRDEISKQDRNKVSPIETRQHLNHLVVVRKTAARIVGTGIDDKSDDWWNHIAFSNLFKIGNATGDLSDQNEYDAQKGFAVELFLRELHEIKSEVVLLLDGLDYSDDFIAALGLEPNVEGMDYVVVAAKVKDTKFVLTRSMIEDVDKCADEILSAISRL
jgi:hypothetical protein